MLEKKIGFKKKYKHRVFQIIYPTYMYLSNSQIE